MLSFNVAVIGAGASGMIAAAEAAKKGARVVIFDKNAVVGRKVLATGNGKCNFTNQKMNSSFYFGDNPEFIEAVLEKFNEKDTILYFKKLGIIPYIRDGYVYPKSEQAESIRHVLERQLESLKVVIRCDEEVINITKKSNSKKNFFEIVTNTGKCMADSVIISTGGNASKVHGSSGDGYRIARNFGHNIVKPLPALSSLILSESFLKAWSGVRFHGRIVLYDFDKNKIASDAGEIILNDFGVSGIPVFQVSRIASKYIDAGKEVYAELDLIPDYTVEELMDYLIDRKNDLSEYEVCEYLDGLINKKLADIIINRLDINSKMTINDINEKVLGKLVHLLKEWSFHVKAVSGFEKAQVTAGGVDSHQIDAYTMESKLCDGLFFSGEVIDVDGVCGGYNLQFAWASGFLAGNHAY